MVTSNSVVQSEEMHEEWLSHDVSLPSSVLRAPFILPTVPKPSRVLRPGGSAVREMYTESHPPPPPPPLQRGTRSRTLLVDGSGVFPLKACRERSGTPGLLQAQGRGDGLLIICQLPPDQHRASGRNAKDLTKSGGLKIQNITRMNTWLSRLAFWIQSV